MADYTINPDAIPSSAMCKCGHPAAAHGSRGKICCACRCKVFEWKKGEDRVFTLPPASECGGVKITIKNTEDTPLTVR